jgi:hypothetical protein
MANEDRLTIVLRDGTKIYCFDPLGVLFKDVMAVFDLTVREGQENVTLNISGDEWPVDLEIPCTSLKYVESHKTEKINFYLPGEN